MRRILAATGQKVPESKPALELNVGHPLVKYLEGVADAGQFKELAQVLYEQAALAEGANSPILPSTCSGSIACWCASRPPRRAGPPMATAAAHARAADAGPRRRLAGVIETPAAARWPDRPARLRRGLPPATAHGGTLDNKVVWTAGARASQLGAPAIRFNFRGVGASDGSYDDGRGETPMHSRSIATVASAGPARHCGSGILVRRLVAVRAAGEAHPARLVVVAPGITQLDVHGAAPPACRGSSCRATPPTWCRRKRCSSWARTLVARARRTRCCPVPATSFTAASTSCATRWSPSCAPRATGS